MHVKSDIHWSTTHDNHVQELSVYQQKSGSENVT